MKRSLIIGAFFALIINLSLTSHVPVNQPVVTIKPAQEKDFSEDQLYTYIKELNIKFPHIVMAQAKLESANFTSNIFKENNNLFGMKEAKVRISTNKGTNRGHAKYDNWKECVLDYALYQATYLSKFKTETKYYSYLAEHYAQNESYADLVKQIAKHYKY
jgi:uncharacterized FlgJ-related protein